MTRTAHETEHEDDPRDVADAHFLIDDGQACLSRCPDCGGHICACMNDSDLVRAADRRYRRVARGDRARRWTP